ncbi:MAG: bifunctional phosphoribosylaminoimidazolecarboxamide formyltransferase/IMP cyclohydrolase [Pseudomonadota bacterium]
MSEGLVGVRRALLSASDKSGLVEFAQALAAAGVELISTGGTAAALREAGLAVRDVAEVTGFPEILDGRVKTLHPAIHGGLLAKGGVAAHDEALAAHAIAPIDLAVITLYPFEETVARGASPDACVEQIDIGGPAMIRAAAKNHGRVTVITAPDVYGEVLAEIEAEGGTTLATRQRLAGAAFARVAAYDAAIAGWFQGQQSLFAPERLTPSGRHAADLRYGENPHQRAALYLSGEERPGAATAETLQGKALSYNNILDADAAFELVAEFDPADGAACAIIKHANPCGVALGADLASAYRAALRCDPTSAFGGIVAFNQPVDAVAAEAMAEVFTEVVIAPQIAPAARDLFARRSNLRLLETGALPDPSANAAVFRQVAGGFLMQERDGAALPEEPPRVVTQRAPTDAETTDLLFAWRVAKHVKSNAIVYAKDGATVGIGAGQMSRVDSAHLAAKKAREIAAAEGLAEPPTVGSAVASDAFFPFADGLLAAVEAGATAVIQPGGSVRDEEVIAAADQAGIAMLFTGRRHFRH